MSVVHHLSDNMKGVYVIHGHARLLMGGKEYIRRRAQSADCCGIELTQQYLYNNSTINNPILLGLLALLLNFR